MNENYNSAHVFDQAYRVSQARVEIVSIIEALEV